jgi:AmiR/NasT family two-component response regulator
MRVSSCWLSTPPGPGDWWREGLAVEQLQRTLNSRVTIEQATGMLAERLGIGADEAFSRLRRYARSHNERLTEVAQKFLNGTIDPGES